MATTKEYHDYIMECLNKAGEVTSKKMMGEYCLYFNGILFGGIYDNRLLVKQTDTSMKLLSDCPLELPYDGSKSPMFLVSEFENADFMKELLEGMIGDLEK
ncbi:MAG: TfoX/Sxy family protein [Treponema sp.]|nr:TfoX/Sxy family protein [Candidatus Treponema equifaecale]